MKKQSKSIILLRSASLALLVGALAGTPSLIFASGSVPVQTHAQQQSRNVKGVVVDETGEPVIGANVTVEGTLIGTITDFNGEFRLDVPAEGILLVSYIGYSNQKVTLTGSTTYHIVLREDSELLDEVVVVGYGTMKKSDISGSVVSVNQEDMMKRNPVNIVQGLQGAAAGVMVSKNSGDPSGAATIRIRGVATVNGSADPLYVVDGVQVGSSADFVNPADVESIEILKDASATAIYGARGANGVIMITTKKGSAGRTNVNFSANFGIQTMARKLDVADADLFAYSVRQGRANEGSAITNEAFTEKYTGQLRTIDWQDVMSQNAFQQNYALSVTGGTEKSQSAFSVGYLKNEGVVLDTDYSRLTARASSNYKVKDFIEIGGSISLEHSEKNVTGNIREWATLTPTMDYVEDGWLVSYNYNDRNAQGEYYTFYQTTSEGDIAKGQDNPYAERKTADKTPDYNNTILANAYLDLKLVKGLSFRTVASYKLDTYDGSTFTVANNRIITSSGLNSFWLKQLQNNETALESYFTYNWKNTNHSVNIVAGNTVSNSWGHWVEGSANDFLADTYRLLSLTSDQSSRTSDGGYYLNSRYVSFYGRALYSYLDRYIVTFTVRRDGSSNFGSGNRWGTFPSAALAWRLSEEEFVQSLDFFSNLKVRLGWGQTGNAGNSTNLSVAQLSSNRISYDWGTLGGSTSGNNKVTGVAQSYLIDTNLKWETNTQTNIGLDIGVLNNSLNFTFDYFIRDSKDLLLYRSVRPSTGFSQMYTNAGHIRNQGFEFSVAYNKRFGDWTLGASLTGSTLKNKVIDVGDPIYASEADDGDLWDTHSITMNGYAVGSYYGYVVDGIFQSQAEIDALNAASPGGTYQETNTSPGDYRYKDLNGDGQINEEDQTVIGNGFPKLNYGLTLNAGYKNFDAMIYLYGMAGVDVYSYSAMKLTSLYKTAGGIQNTLKDYINHAWTSTNPSNENPRFTIVDYNNNKKSLVCLCKKRGFPEDRKYSDRIHTAQIIFNSSEDRKCPYIRIC